MSKQLWLVLSIIALLAFFYRVRTVLTPFLFAVIIAYILYPIIVMIEKRGASRTAAILLVYALFGVVFGSLFWVVLPRLAGELEGISKEVPQQFEEWQKLGEDTVGYFRKMELPGVLRDALQILLERVEIALEQLASKLTGLLMGVFANFISLLIAPVLAFYFLRDHQAMRGRILQYVPANYRGDVQQILSEINTALNGFFRGQLLVCFFVGLVVYGGLRFLKIPYALFIGLLAGIFDIIPYFGPVLGFLPAAAFAFMKSPTTVLWVLVVFIGANQLENSIISPKIIGDQVGLHPLVVIFAVFVGGDLLGIVGMLVAIPIAAIIKVFLEFWLLRKPNKGF